MANSLLDKIPQLGQVARPGLQKDTILDKLYAYLLDETSVTLTDADKARLDRLHHAFALQRQGYADMGASKILVKKYNISRATAYRDLAESKEFFGDIQKAGKDAERYLMGQMLLDAYRLAKKQKDPKHMIKAMEIRARVLGLDKETEHIDPASLGNNTYVMQIIVGQAPGQPDQQPQTIDLSNPGKLPPAQLNQVLEALQETDQLTEAQLLEQLDKSEREGDEN